MSFAIFLGYLAVLMAPFVYLYEWLSMDPNQMFESIIFFIRDVVVTIL